jgi:hypothetical protein
MLLITRPRSKFTYRSLDRIITWRIRILKLMVLPLWSYEILHSQRTSSPKVAVWARDKLALDISDSRTRLLFGVYSSHHNPTQFMVTTSVTRLCKTQFQGLAR